MPPKRQLRAASPREIRRAFGENALNALNSHADAITDLNSQTAFLTDRASATDASMTALGQRAERVSLALENRIEALVALRNRGILGRLRWLVLGQ